MIGTEKATLSVQAEATSHLALLPERNESPRVIMEDHTSV